MRRRPLLHLVAWGVAIAVVAGAVGILLLGALAWAVRQLTW